MKLFLVALLYLAVTGNNEWVALADEAPGPQGKVPAPQHTTTLTVQPHATETSRSFVSPTASPAPTDVTNTIGPGEGYGCFYHQGRYSHLPLFKDGVYTLPGSLDVSEPYQFSEGGSDD